MQVGSRMAADNGKVPPLETLLNEEVAMRNTCRKMLCLSESKDDLFYRYY